MIGLDTNILLRYITNDDPEQGARAAQIVEALSEESPGYLNTVVLVEMTWVLKAVYGYSRSQIASVIREVMAAPELKVEHSGSVWAALGLYRSGKADFEDALIGRINAARRCSTTYSFDQKAVKSLPDFTSA